MYVALRYDPGDPDRSSGADHNFYNALVKQGFDIKIVGPLQDAPWRFEELVRRLYQRYREKKFLKFLFSHIWSMAQTINQVVYEWQPDVVFTIFPAALVFYKGDAPCVARLDTTFIGQQKAWPLYGNFGLALSVWQEKRAFAKCTALITHSDWSKKILMSEYGVEAKRIFVLANPSALPEHVVPESLQVRQSKQLEEPLRLLLVGREFERKGIDKAIEIVERLNGDGLRAELTICGYTGENKRYVNYMGLFKKGEPQQLQAYVEHYRRAHLLLHPAIFDASPIVTSEAAAFAVPTITNDSGGLATSVKDQVSGIVLPGNSPATDYVAAIVALLRQPERYYALCETTRRRYEQELNWDVAGKKVAAILRQAAASVSV